MKFKGAGPANSIGTRTARETLAVRTASSKTPAGGQRYKLREQNDCGGEASIVVVLMVALGTGRNACAT
jgi:hypothetical protein